MKRTRPNKKIQCFLIALLMNILHIPISTATSRMGTATISDSDGIPCFSVPETSETKFGLPLHGITISELPDGSTGNIPLAVWSFKESNHQAPPILMPKQCILYGESPPNTIQRTLRPLELLKIYSIYMRARHDDSSMMGYMGQFCIKPAGSGRTTVQVISEDPRLGEHRYKGCVK